MAQDNKINWIIKGMTYKNLGKTNLEALDEITIPVSDNRLKMPESNIFGLAIDAPLAVYYIKKLWDAIGDKKLSSVYSDTSKLIENLQDASLGLVSTDEGKKAELKKITDQILELSKKQQWLVDLLQNSAAITMDKNVLSSTLNQTGCEGVRFYLSLKEQADLSEILTLVTVGVDKKGYDLNFEEQGDKLKNPLQKIRLIDIETSSLCYEYPCTSHLLKKTFDSEDLKPYVLYKFSMVAEP